MVRSAMSMFGKTIGDRLAGGQPSRIRSLVVAAGTGVAAGTLVYKLLRSGGAADEGRSNGH
jgi:hypothetical protein